MQTFPKSMSFSIRYLHPNARHSYSSAATFYSVSISKPIPVWFGKKFKILTTRFPNQFQFGLEKNYNFDDSFSKPIPVWFGKNDHISEAKNSKLIIIWTKESWFPASVTGSSFLKLCWCDSIRWAGWRGDAQWGRGCQQGGRQGVALSVEVGVCDQLGDNIGCWVSLRWWQADVRDWRGVGVGGVGGWSPRSRVRLKVLLKTANFICFRWVDIIQVSVSIPLVRCASGNVYVLNTFRCSNIRAMPTAHLGSITDAEKVKVK